MLIRKSKTFENYSNIILKFIHADIKSLYRKELQSLNENSALVFFFTFTSNDYNLQYCTFDQALSESLHKYLNYTVLVLDCSDKK